MAFAKKKNIAIAVIIAVVVCAVMFFAFKEMNVQPGASPDAPATMPAGHNDRFDNLGPAGCYGCHGQNDNGKTMLKAATALPADHYANGVGGTSVTDIAGARIMCNTCHVHQ